MNYGWVGSFEKFIKTDETELVEQLCLHIYEQTLSDAKINPLEESTIPQIRAWFDCVKYLKEEIPYFIHLPGFLIFEYEILRTGGRRPDVLLFLPGEVIVLEFKMYLEVSDADYMQISHYVRDIENYHSTVQDYHLKVRGGLVSTKLQPSLLAVDQFQVYQIGKNSLRELIRLIEKRLESSELIEPEQFINGEYKPIPSIIEAARTIMRNESLPEIKSIRSSNFEKVLAEIYQIINKAETEKSHHLILVSGVPGAGKTYLGLKVAHEVEEAIYLSGNGPLVDVLQDILKNTVFVQSLLAYKRDYLKHGKVPEENVIIFDEAQRAWDAHKMGGNKSEPDIIIEIAKHKPWSVVVALIGEGQEIHDGEESGISLWNEAIKNKKIYVHGKHHQSVFPYALQYKGNPFLHLNVSLRTHNAFIYYEWVEALIAGDWERKKRLEAQLTKARYFVKYVDDLDEAKRYVKKNYEGTDKTYGVIISSAMKRPNGIKVVPYGQHVAYFNQPSTPYYCKNLEYAATEFQVQGLELDMAIVYWGDDLLLENGFWNYRYPKQGITNQLQMRLNVYRVLLTRGRDGVIIYRNKKKLKS